MQNLSIISESGLYTVIIRSNKEQAKPFRRWVTHEVIPSIREQGSYNLAELSPSEIILLQAQRLVEIEREQKEQAERLKSVEAKQKAIEMATRDFSVMGYCNFKEIKVNLKLAQKIGRLAAKISRERDLPVGSVRDPRFGKVNSYLEDVLEEAVSKIVEL